MGEPPTPRTPPGGRGPRGASKAAIHLAATELFAENGFANTPVRDIASRAGVDPALVMRHFGSKEKLFLQTMELAAEDVLQFDGPLETLGERIVRFVLGTDNRVRATYLALVRASDANSVQTMLTALHDEAFVQPLFVRLEGRDRELRARLIAAMIGGLMYSLWTVGDDVLLRTSADTVAAMYAPALQVLITPAA